MPLSSRSAEGVVVLIAPIVGCGTVGNMTTSSPSSRSSRSSKRLVLFLLAVAMLVAAAGLVVFDSSGEVSVASVDVPVADDVAVNDTDDTDDVADTDAEVVEAPVEVVPVEHHDGVAEFLDGLSDAVPVERFVPVEHHDGVAELLADLDAWAAAEAAAEAAALAEQEAAEAAQPEPPPAPSSHL